MSALLPLAATPTPSPSPTSVAILEHGNGFMAFVVIFVLALACIGIGVFMARQLRRMNRNYARKVEDGELEPEPERPASGIATPQNPQGWSGPGTARGPEQPGGPDADGTGSVDDRS